MLRVFKQGKILRVAASDITDVLPLMRVSDYLSDIAEVLVETVVGLCWDHLVAKHGQPVCRAGTEQRGRGFAVLAYGKLGGLELGYGSDLDLVFLHAARPGETISWPSKSRPSQSACLNPAAKAGLPVNAGVPF